MLKQKSEGDRHLDKVTLDNSANVTSRVTDDIPVALRDAPKNTPKTSLKKSWLVGGLATVGVVALGAGAFVSVQLQRSQISKAEVASAAPTASGNQAPASTAASPSPDSDAILGHLRYAEAPQAELSAIVSDGSIKLRKAAAKAYLSMEAAARQDGVILTPISGFRTLADQNYLFFDKKAERGQVAKERAKVSAPPGYSEHHTGYALDIGDGSVPATNLSESFENTPAFRWLQQNAAYYSFEISFPKGNEQGVSYEPWHWRFVGDRNSLETFYKARGKK